MNSNENKPQEAVVFHAKGDDKWLKEAMSPVSFDPKKKTPENRKYLVLVYFTEKAAEDLEYPTTFILATGRTNTYNEIKNYLDVMDLEQSVVMLEGNPALVDQITVLQFLRHIRDDELIEDESGYLVDEAIAEYDEEA